MDLQWYHQWRSQGGAHAPPTVSVVPHQLSVVPHQLSVVPHQKYF